VAKVLKKSQKSSKFKLIITTNSLKRDI